MKFPRRFALFNAFIIAFNISVSASGICGTRDGLVKMLNDRYQETVDGMGVAGNNVVVEVFSSKTGTWTILVTRPDGVACFIAAGVGWQKLKQAVGGIIL